MDGAHLLVIFLLYTIQSASSTSSQPGDHENLCRGRIAAILDCGSLSGRQEKIAMDMAVEDFRNLTGCAPTLHARDSRRDPITAASIAMTLIKEQHVQVIIGPRSWQEVAFVAELGGRAQIPVLSSATMITTSKRLPFLVRVSPSDHLQMRAIAAIVQSWGWRWVSVIYEDVDLAGTTIIPHLNDAIREVGSEIDSWVALRPSAVSVSQELELLRRRQCRVFVVHTTLSLATSLFAEAKQMGMMEKEYVWIVTDGITSLLDSIESSVIANTMQGIIGVKNYFYPSSRLRDFRARLRKRIQLKYPKEKKIVPQISALQAYDVVWALSTAMKRTNVTGNFQNNKEESNETFSIPISQDGQSLLEAIMQSNFTGLSSEFRYVEGEFAPTRMFQIVNVIGKSFRELGFWSHHIGFSESADQELGNYTYGMKKLGQVFWPGGPWTVPRGWAPPTDEKPLRIAVLSKSVFPDFVSVREANGSETTVDGFIIDVFNETLKHLPYHLPYKFVPNNGTYQPLMEGLSQNKDYDMLVGDTSISSGRYHFVEFSQAYTPSGLVMVVPTGSDGPGSKAWIFLKPFTASLWVLTAVVSVYNGLVVWLIERRCNTEFQGSVWNQMGTLFWLSFTTLLSPGEKLHSNLSRAAMVVWLFTALVLTSNYTASLSSLLTAQRFEPNFVTVGSLKRSNAVVGCNRGSVVAKYLEDVLGFHPKYIQSFASEDDYPQALRRGDIKAAFLRVPHANLFLAKYCTEFATTGPVYHVGGLGFVFPKGSPLLSDFSEALLQVFESGTIQRLETAMLASYNCSGQTVDTTDFDRLSPESFWGLFALTMFASTISLMLYGVFLHNKGLGCDAHMQGGCNSVQDITGADGS